MLQLIRGGMSREEARKRSALGAVILIHVAGTCDCCFRVKSLERIL
jgi:hypothetical protein